MAISLSSPVTGASQTNLTTPTYTVVVDVAPDSNGKQYAVTALGGTQSGVTTTSVASPFTFTFWKPKVLKVLGNANNSGFIASVPRNVYKALTRKGVTPAVNQPANTMLINTTIDVPAGADTYDAANVRAALSLHIGALQQLSAGIGDTAVTGTM
jgi:hypothetical protein